MNLFDKYDKKQSFEEHTECIDKHLSNFFSDNEMTVFHEIVSIDFHLDVYFVNSIKYPFNILLTSGMSLFEMNVGDSLKNPENYKFAELMVIIPKEIEFKDAYTEYKGHGWIISMMKKTARFPHHYNTWLGIGHTIRANEDFTSYGEETNFVGAVITSIYYI